MTSWINIHALLHGLSLSRSFVPRAKEKAPSSTKYCYLFVYFLSIIHSINLPRPQLVPQREYILSTLWKCFLGLISYRTGNTVCINLCRNRVLRGTCGGEPWREMEWTDLAHVNTVMNFRLNESEEIRRLTKRLLAFKERFSSMQLICWSAEID